MFDFIRRCLGNKIMATVTLGMLLVMGVEIVLRIYFGTRDRIELMETLSVDLAASTYSGIKYPMSVGDSKAVERVLADVRQKMKDIEVFVCDFDQQIIWSTHEEKVHTKIADSISGIELLQALGETLRTGAVPRNSFESEMGGKNYLITMQPIFNAEECYHCHGSSKTILGGMVIRSNLQTTLAAVAAARNRSLFLMVLGISAILAFIYTLVKMFIQDPVESLAQGVQRVSSGELDFEIQSRSSDEIGELARSFNRMTHDLKTARDEITNWAVTVEDLVEERTQQLRRAQESALQAEKMASMGRLAAIVAHEINNPLAGIRTYAKLLMKKSSEVMRCTDFRYMEILETIESESARCGEIVRNLLQFARPSKPLFKKQDINLLIEESLVLVRHKISMLHIESRLSLAPEPLIVECDGQKIKQAMVALLLNASDAVQTDTGLIEIRSRNVPEKKGVEVAIEDNGYGMDEETKKHMFEPFFTTKPAPQDQESGMNIGIGVSVVYEIIKSHHGEIFVDSELGKGTTITIFLPVDPKLVLPE